MMNSTELNKIERGGLDSLVRCKAVKKAKNDFNDDATAIITNYWDRFHKIRKLAFKGSDLQIVNDHCMVLTLLVETHRTTFDLNELLEKTYSKKKLLAAREVRLEWIIEMKQGLDRLVQKLDLRVEKGDPSRAKIMQLKEIPELPVSVEAPLLYLEDRLHRDQYQNATATLFSDLAPQLTELHGLIVTMQHKRVDESVMLLTFAEWIGSALQFVQADQRWLKVTDGKIVARVLWSAFDSALSSSWGSLRRQYGVDLCTEFKLLAKQHKLKRIVSFKQVKRSSSAVETKTASSPEIEVDTQKILSAPPTMSSPSLTEPKTISAAAASPALAASTSSPLQSPATSIASPLTSPAQTTTTVPVVEKKPCEWKKHLDVKTQRHYYYHTPTGKSQWLVPPDYHDPPAVLSNRSAPSLVSNMSPGGGGGGGGGSPISTSRSIVNTTYHRKQPSNMKIG